MSPMRPMALLAMLALCATPARAQTPQVEEPDATRLDVERLPPEAIALDRSMFSRGLFVEADLGGRGFVGGVGDVSLPGVMTRVFLGYELSDWFAAGAGVELSLHATDAPPPPQASNFQIIDVLVQARLQWPFAVRAALWLGAEASLTTTPGNLLAALGLPRGSDPGFTYGGSLGFDWHLWSRHHSLGLLAGARRYPTLDGADGSSAIGVHSAAYLKYVF